MAARAGLRRDGVIAAAVETIDDGVRPADLSLSALARRLGIRPQSLYAHIDGADGLRRAVAVAGLDALATVVTAAGIGGLVFAEIVAFVVVLGLTLAYVWRKGGLEWDR